MGHPLSPPRGWSYAWGVGVDAHGEGGALPERGPQAGETGGPERQGPRARAGAGLDPGLPSPPKDAVRPLPALPCFGTLAGFPTPAPKAPGEKLQVSLGGGRPESSPCFAAWPEPASQPGKEGQPGRALGCPPRPPGSGGPALPGLPASRPRPSQPHPEQGRGQPFTVDGSPFYRRENHGPQSPVVAAGQMLAERGLGPDAALCPLPEDVHRSWLTNLSSKPGGAPCRLPGWTEASCQAQDKGPTFKIPQPWAFLG